MHSRHSFQGRERSRWTVVSGLFIRVRGRAVDPTSDSSLGAMLSSRRVITVTKVLHFIRYVNLLYGGTKQFTIHKSRDQTTLNLCTNKIVVTNFKRMVILESLASNHFFSLTKNVDSSKRLKIRLFGTKCFGSYTLGGGGGGGGVGITERLYNNCWNIIDILTIPDSPSVHYHALLAYCLGDVARSESRSRLTWYRVLYQTYLNL